MISHMEEKVFKNLIQSTGYDKAPEGMANSILNRLEVEKSPQLANTGQLISNWVWIGLAVVFVGLFIITFQNPSPGDSFYFLDDLQKISLPNLQFDLLDRIHFFEGFPPILFILIPFIAVEFYLLKRYVEGAYL